jgi:hypothetical protein
MASYRLERFDDALADLSPAEETVASDHEHARQSLAFRAMAEMRSGNSAAARATLATLRADVEQASDPPGRETLNLIAEAEALLKGDGTID